MFKKISYSSGGIQTLDKNESKDLLASPEITERLDKFAKKVLAIAPKSEDFLYFTIIFMKAAEASTINDRGEPIKIGSEQAWGHFDENWRWHGNVKAHKNRNLDIFPALELKKAHKKWVGMPLCVDHKSDSVDGVRGVILDTHYDDKLKQIVGLCALDRKAYPDLARKVETGVVRFGSMGTAVGVSVCTECGNHAKVASDFCIHVKNRSCWGEINLDLKPIEYSLVVQPAEPGAMLLKCFASIREHGDELKHLGVDDIDSFIRDLPSQKAIELEDILKEACGENGCSILDREKIIKAYLNNVEITKTASTKIASLSVDDIEKFTQAMRNMKETSGLDFDPVDEISLSIYKPIFESFNLSIPDSSQEFERLTKDENWTGSTSLVPESDNGSKDYTGVNSSSMMSSVSPPNPDSFNPGGVGPEKYVFSNDNSTQDSTNLVKQNIEIKSLLEDMMNEAKLKRRAAELQAEKLKRQAYMQGANGDEREPSGFKKEDPKKYWEDERWMHQDKSMGGDSGMVPGDKETKEKLSRAQLRERALKRQAYMQGANGNEREPSGFKKEDPKKYWEQERWMHQDKSMGGDKGMVPGDKEAKEKLSRAAYNGPALSTKFKQARALDGSLNKRASTFEVYSGDDLIISNTAEDILGPNLDEDFAMLTSPEFGKTVVSKIRSLGLSKVAAKLSLFKSAQEMAPAPAAPPVAPAAPVSMEGMMDEMSQMPPAEVAETNDIQVSIESALNEVEDGVDKIRDLLGEEAAAGGPAAAELPGDKLALSSTLVRDLKLALAEAEEVSEELHYVTQVLESDFEKLSSDRRRELRKTARSALNDALKFIGESNTLVRVASVVKNDLVKTSEFSESNTSVESDVATEQNEESDLIQEALAIRAARRSNLLKKAATALRKKAMETADEQNSASDKPWEAGNTEDKENDAKDKMSFDAKVSPTAVVSAEEAIQSVVDAISDVAKEPTEEPKEEEKKSEAKTKLTETFAKKKASENEEVYRVKCRRAYDLALEMQKKGMIDSSTVSRDKQVDSLLNLDDKGFESFKRLVANSRPAPKIAEASDLGGINNGIRNSEDSVAPAKTDLAQQLSKLFK